MELGTALRDSFVLELENGEEMERLLSESVDSLSFAKALEMAQSMHCARVAVQWMQDEAPTSAAARAQPVFAMRAPTSSYSSASSIMPSYVKSVVQSVAIRIIPKNSAVLLIIRSKNVIRKTI